MVVTSIDIWEKFLSIPLAIGVDYGMPMRVVELLEQEFEALYVRDIQDVTPEMVLGISQVDKVTLRQLQEGLSLLFKAVEKGELEWIFSDMSN